MSGLNVDKLGRHVHARITESKLSKGTCSKCGGVVRRSWLTGMLHKNCRACRYLIMTYGPSISVVRY